jgi:hypothetical protein
LHAFGFVRGSDGGTRTIRTGVPTPTRDSAAAIVREVVRLEQEQDVEPVGRVLEAGQPVDQARGSTSGSWYAGTRTV